MIREEEGGYFVQRNVSLWQTFSSSLRDAINADKILRAKIEILFTLFIRFISSHRCSNVGLWRKFYTNACVILHKSAYIFENTYKRKIRYLYLLCRFSCFFHKAISILNLISQYVQIVCDSIHRETLSLGFY